MAPELLDEFEVSEHNVSMMPQLELWRLLSTNTNDSDSRLQLL